jgi:hypothetical protein
MDWRGWPSRSSWFQLCPQGVDSPRAGGRQSATCEFFPCSSCSCSASLSIRRGFEFSLCEVSDSPQQRADGPRVLGGQSACSPRTVHFSRFATGGSVRFNGRSAAQAGQSAGRVPTVRGTLPDGPRGPSRTVRPAWPDGPPESGSFASWFNSSLPFSCFRVCLKESFLRLEVDPSPRCLGDWCVIRSIACV